MARKTLTIVIDTPGRDLGKSFFIREMSATKAEKWACKALLSLARSGLQVPESIAAAGLAGVAAMGFRALMGVRWQEAEPLLDEMFECVAIQPDPARPQVQRPLIEDDIEEVSTRVKLRQEIFNLHVDFSSLAGHLTSG